MILCISMDLDPLWCYRQIYGLEPKEEPDPVTRVASARFVQLMEGMGPGTLFVVGRELEDQETQKTIQEVQSHNHEIANHTYSHPYDLFLQSPQEIQQQIQSGAQLIEQVCQKLPEGFRAPGYMLGGRILPALAKNQVRYDSSILPSMAYQGIKAMVMAVLKMRGKKIQAKMGDVRETLAPSQPYRPDLVRPWRQGQAPLLELPISSVLGIPLIGSLLALAGPRAAGMLASLASNLGFVNLELHGVDLMDIQTDRLDPALGVQRDLHIPWQRKAEIFRNFIERLLRTHRVLTLKGAATILSQ